MRTRNAGKNRRKFLLALLAILIAGGYVTYRWTLSRQSGPAVAVLARAAYDRGTASYAANDFVIAFTQFDEAAQLTEKAIASYDPRKIPANELVARKQMQGELFWLRARTIRDRAFAQAARDGTPIAETLDSSTGEKFRAFTAIPDAVARLNAVASVRAATDIVFDNPELVRDALRLELVMQPMQWTRIERLCIMQLKIEPKDPRALYFLARYEFDQPGSDGEAGSLTYENRDPTRIARAREYMVAARAAGSPYWRSIHLEAEILNWLSRDARKRDPVKANAIREEIRTLIFAQPDGALERAKRGDQWTNLSGQDVRGIVAVPAFALELSADDPVLIRGLVKDALGIFERLAKNSTSPTNLAEAGDGTIDALIQASVTLARHDPAGWVGVLEEAEGLFAKYPQALGKPRAAVRFVPMYARLPGSAPGTTRATDVRTKQLLNHALASSSALAVAPVKQLELRADLLDVLALADAPEADVEAQLTLVRRLDEPLAKAVVQFHEAVAAGRSGLPIVARRKFESLIDNKASPEIAARSMAALAVFAFDTEDYNLGLGCLREVEAAFAKIDLLSPWDATWLNRLAGSSAEVTLRQVLATYELGRARIQHWLRTHPGQPLPDDIRTATEQVVQPYPRKLQLGTDADRLARSARIRFLALAGQTALAEKQYAILKADDPKSADLLRLYAAAFAGADPDAAAVAKVDAMLAEFLRVNPASAAAKAFKLEWLLASNRRADALAYLRSPAEFSPRPDPLLEAAVAGTLFNSDGLDDVSTILAALPAEPGAASTIIAGSLSTADEESLTFRRRDADCKRRVTAAWKRFFDGQYEAAAEGFLALTDIVALRPATRTGLTRCLLHYADIDNAKAAAFLTKLQARYPDEASIYLAFGLVALRNDDLGEPTDSWDNSKSMWAALNRWQLIANAYGVPAQIAAAMKMRFLMLASRFEDAMGISRKMPKPLADDPAILLLVCELHLRGPYRDLDAAKKDLGKAFAANPDDADRFHRLEARLRMEAGDFASARKVCELAVQNNPQSAADHALLIDVLTAQQDSAAAMQAAFRWQTAQPANPLAVTALIQQLDRSGAEAAAKPAAETFVNAAKLRGREYGIAARVAVAEGFLGHDDAETERWLREALETEPADAKGQHLAGVLAERRKDFDLAMKHYAAALKARPHDLASAARTMRILNEVKKNPEAAYTFGLQARTLPGTTRLLSAERLPAEFLRQWGAAALASRDRDRLTDARDALTIGAVHHPEAPGLLVALAELQNALGEGTRAAENLTTAYKIASDAKSPLTPQDRRDTLERVEAARKKLRE